MSRLDEILTTLGLYWNSYSNIISFYNSIFLGLIVDIDRVNLDVLSELSLIDYLALKLSLSYCIFKSNHLYYRIENECQS